MLVSFLFNIASIADMMLYKEVNQSKIYFVLFEMVLSTIIIYFNRIFGSSSCW